MTSAELNKWRRLYEAAEKAFEAGTLSEADYRKAEEKYLQAKDEYDAEEWQWMADAMELLQSDQVDGDEAAKVDFLYGDAWDDHFGGGGKRVPPTHLADPKGNLEQGSGLVAHRGIMSPTERELLRHDVVQGEVEGRLIHTFDEINSCFGPGRLTFRDQKRRAWLEDRFLEIQGAGGNMAQLAKTLGWEVRDDGYCRRMSEALKRARARRNS